MLIGRYVDFIWSQQMIPSFEEKLATAATGKHLDKQAAERERRTLWLSADYRALLMFSWETRREISESRKQEIERGKEECKERSRDRERCPLAKTGSWLMTQTSPEKRQVFRGRTREWVKTLWVKADGLHHLVSPTWVIYHVEFGVERCLVVA